MAHGHPLGAARRSGGEHRIGGIVRAQRGDPIDVGHCRGGGHGVTGAVDGEHPDAIGAGEHPDAVGAGDARRAIGIPGEQHRRAGGGQDVADPVGGRVGSDGHELSAGCPHRVHGHHHLNRTLEPDADRGVGTDTHRDEFARQRIHPITQFGVADRPVPGTHRDLLRRRGDTSAQQPGHRVRSDVDRSPGRGVEQSALIGRSHQVGVAHHGVGVGGQAVEQPDQPLGEPGNRDVVEQVGGVGDGSGPVGTVRRWRQHHLDIEFGRCRRRIQRLHPDPGDGQLHVDPGLRVERERHLRQRRECLAPNRIERLHDHLERHVGVRVGIQIDAPDLAQQFGERIVLIDLGAQHERVDEHADEWVENLLTATGDRRRDRDVVGGAQPRQEHGQRRVHHHERGGPVAACDLIDLGTDGRRERETDPRTAMGGDDGPRAGAGDVKHLGQPVEPVAPALKLAPHHRIRDDALTCPGVTPNPLRRFRITENAMLPQGEVGELHRQRLPRRRGPAAAGGEGGHHVGHQRRHRLAVDRDVVGDDGEQVLAGRLLVQPHPQRPGLGHVETGGNGGHDVGLGVDDPPDLAPVELVELPDDLPGLAVDRRERRAQHLVPGNHVSHRFAQGGGVDGAGQPQYRGHVVGGLCGVELVDEPQPGLGERQRDDVRARIDRGDRRHDPVVAGNLGDESANRVCGEHIAHRHRDTERVAGACCQTHRGQRVAAQVEERRRDAHPVDTEDVGEHLRDEFLGVGGGFGEVVAGDAELGFRQQFSVELSGGAERHVGEWHPCGRHHEFRQSQRGERRDAGDVDIGRRQISGQHLVPGGGGDDGSGGVHHAGRGGQHRLDLTELESLTAQLDLKVCTAQVFQCVGSSPAHQVAGAIEASAIGAQRIGDEPFGGQVRARGVATGQLHTAEIQFADHARGHRVQAFVEHERRRVGYGRTDRDDLVADPCFMGGDVDRGLGGSVQVDQPHRGHPGEQSPCGRSPERLPGGEHDP